VGISTACWLLPFGTEQLLRRNCSADDLHLLSELREVQKSFKMEKSL
jgi:hypothetical protein